jgi:transglutaminase-like putative cysteine protease
MPHVEITHSTEYTYRRPVGLLRHRLMVRPQDSHDLRLQQATLTVDPAPATTRWAHDVFGNSICLLEWPEALRTKRLHIVSRLALDHYPSGSALSRVTLDPAAQRFPFSYAAEEVPDLARLTERQLPDPLRAVDAWARGFLLDGGGEEVRTLALLEAMTRAIQGRFTYVAREEEGTQAPVETLASGQGTCRDFALLMMEAARSLGLAARFVTGYLYDAGGAAARGGGATHAWCSIYLPGAGWVEYDHTNGLVAGTNLIRVGVARTPEQAMPVAGGFVGDVADPLGLVVDVVARAVTEVAEPRAA